MTKSSKPEVTDFFWGLADPLLSSGVATEGALMGFPCLRVDGEFFATCDHRTGELIVKLPRARVQGTDRPRTWAGVRPGRPSLS